MAIVHKRVVYLGKDMFENGRKFFDQTNFGNSRIDSWVPGVFLVIAAFILGQVLAATVLVGVLLMDYPDLFKTGMDMGVFNAAVKESIGTKPLLYFGLLSSFVFPFLATFIVVKKIHKRFPKTVLTAAQKFRWKRFAFALVVTFIAATTLAAIGHYSGSGTLKFTFNANLFFTFAVISLLLIPIQSAAEEIVVRGYFNQGLCHYIGNKWIVFAFTSALFASLHLANPESQSSADIGFSQHALVMGSYFMFGFILSIVVYFEGGLESAIGVHVANNLYVSMFVNYEGSALPTPTVFQAPASDGKTAFISTVLYLSVIALILYKTREQLPELRAEEITLEPDVQRL